MYSKLKSQFYITPDITFLNFGSFGATPKPVFEEYQRFQLELEREPVQFVMVTGPVYLKRSREALAEYINCSPDDVVFTTNPSYAINTIAKSFPFKPGDEMLGTNIEYGALDRTWNYYCKKSQAKYIRQNIDLPIVSKEQVIEQFFKGLSAKTKAIYISQITSATGLILPVKEICEIAKEKGLLTIVDGAHVPGHIPLDLQAIKADIFTGACHKWMMAPKGCSFLYVKKEYQDMFDPLVISWGYEALFPSYSQFQDYHQFNGTRDFSAFLSIPSVIKFMNENNWEEVTKYCRDLVKKNALRFCDLVGTVPITPISDEFLGQMFSIPVNCKDPEKLQRLLFEKYKIEVPVARQDERTFLRYSIQVFNTQEDLDVLYRAIEDILRTMDLISK
ncbi:MAG: aminotransferase class V-fold PLP-dependent enzyme [Bacteroidetes bacterium]|nr:aminotransferase class V-fold PLP-dependent enzyme [Bacteroidota bacterium]